MRRCNRQIHILPLAVITCSLVSSLYTCSMECVCVFYDGITPGFLPMEMLQMLMINKKPCLTACITPYSESVTGNSLPGVHIFRCVLHSDHTCLVSATSATYNQPHFGKSAQARTSWFGSIEGKQSLSYNDHSNHFTWM